MVKAFPKTSSPGVLSRQAVRYRLDGIEFLPRQVGASAGGSEHQLNRSGKSLSVLNLWVIPAHSWEGKVDKDAPEP